MAKIVYDNTKLHRTEEIALLRLIEDSIIRRYDGKLERRQDPRSKRNTYKPLDTDAIRTLLTTLWGEYISAETIKTIFNTLVEDDTEAKE
jgi:hypothetical protein